MDDQHALVRTLATARAIAQEAGRALLEGWGTRPAVKYKDLPTDPVTEYDRRAEAIVVERLRAAFPDDGIVGEEGTSERSSAERVWYVDPLDGTNNFAHGMPFFAVSLGLARGAEPLCGIVHAPAVGWTFSGAVGVGAFLNDAPVAPSPTQRLAGALLATGFPPAGKKVPHSNIAEVEAITASSQGIRRVGSAALDLAFVACGWLDAYWERHIYPWDLAGGAAIVRAAGGTVTDLDGRPFDARSGRALATNGHVHDEVSAVLRRAASERGTPWP